MVGRKIVCLYIIGDTKRAGGYYIDPLSSSSRSLQLRNVCTTESATFECKKTDFRNQSIQRSDVASFPRSLKFRCLSRSR